MEPLKEIGGKLDKIAITAQEQLEKTVQGGLRRITLKRLWGGFLLAIGYLLSPLCWWNDLFFNLPVAYFFGYVCSWISPNLLIPGSIAGYWLSNIVGILLMQAGVVEVFQEQPQERNFKKELLTGVASSTVYTLLILVLLQFKILDAPLALLGNRFF